MVHPVFSTLLSVVQTSLSGLGPTTDVLDVPRRPRAPRPLLAPGRLGPHRVHLPQAQQRVRLRRMHGQQVSSFCFSHNLLGKSYHKVAHHRPIVLFATFISLYCGWHFLIIQHGMNLVCDSVCTPEIVYRVTGYRVKSLIG